jgi:phosphoribosylformylglycinamidine cyclo-ligase
MCADDVVCHGARPAYFLDYVAVGRLHPESVARLVGGVGQACTDIGCALVGGETAEHPGLMADDAFDLAGFCVGFVERQRLVDARSSRDGDAIIGLASAGLHSNGYSLVRKLIDDGRLPLTDDLLTPTRLYAPAVLALLDELRARGLRAGGLSHITGGGLARNLPRALGDDLGALVRTGSWQVPPIFDEIARAADMDAVEMRATFNCGIGFAIVVESAAVQPAIDNLAASGIDAWQIGEVRSAAVLGGERYAEA